MLYLILLYPDPELPMPEEEMENHFAVARDTRTKGQYITSEALYPPNFAKTLRTRNGKTVKTDGPFAETKEVLGGFYVLDCESEDEALSYAERLPAARNGAVEIRPIFNVPGWDYEIAADRRDYDQPNPWG